VSVSWSHFGKCWFLPWGAEEDPLGNVLDYSVPRRSIAMPISRQEPKLFES
jgi:hypothetical protein